MYAYTKRESKDRKTLYFCNERRVKEQERV